MLRPNLYFIRFLLFIKVLWRVFRYGWVSSKAIDGVN
jgi:hypothetical protein